MASLKSILPQYLKTPHLTLEHFDYSDAHYACLLASMNTPTAHKNMGDFGIRTPAEFDKLNINTRIRAEVLAAPVAVDTDLYYVLRLGDKTGPFVGGVSLCQRGPNVPPDLGWCLLEEYHRRGFASEAARELLRMVREDLGIKEVIAWPGAGNIPSIGVAKKVGFVLGGVSKDDEGVEKAVYILPGMNWDNEVVLSLYGS